MNSMAASWMNRKRSRTLLLVSTRMARRRGKSVSAVNSMIFCGRLFSSTSKSSFVRSVMNRPRLSVTVSRMLTRVTSRTIRVLSSFSWMVVMRTLSPAGGCAGGGAGCCAGSMPAIRIAIRSGFIFALLDYRLSRRGASKGVRLANQTSSSGGNGDSTVTGTPVAGCAKPTRCACRKKRASGRPSWTLAGAP